MAAFLRSKRSSPTSLAADIQSKKYIYFGRANGWAPRGETSQRIQSTRCRKTFCTTRFFPQRPYVPSVSRGALNLNDASGDVFPFASGMRRYPKHHRLRPCARAVPKSREDRHRRLHPFAPRSTSHVGVSFAETTRASSRSHVDALLPPDSST